MDPEVWNLLRDGVVRAVERTGPQARVIISAPHLASSFGGDAFDLVTSGTRRIAYRPRTERWDEPWLEDADVARERPQLVEAKQELSELRVECVGGVLIVDGDALALEVAGVRVSVEALRVAVGEYWTRWLEARDPSEFHPLTLEALRGSPKLMPRLLDAWRAERTSELAEVIEVLGRAFDSERRPIVAMDDLGGWPEAFRRGPTAALEALAEAATSTFDLLEDDAPPQGSPTLGAWLEAKSALSARWWRSLGAAVATLRAEPPDPRIGRAMSAMLRSPSDHWFRVDQVAHAVASFEASDRTPSFADHALALMELHADAGTPARLEACADRVAIECDCNGAEMVARLRALATDLRARLPRDRCLVGPARSALVLVGLKKLGYRRT